jgi:hypothetical protein
MPSFRTGDKYWPYSSVLYLALLIVGGAKHRCLWIIAGGINRNRKRCAAEPTLRKFPEAAEQSDSMQRRSGILKKMESQVSAWMREE